MRLYANNASTRLAAPAGTGDTTLTVDDGSVFPAPVAPDFAVLTLETVDRLTQEVVLLTARSGNSLTVTRAQEGTTAQLWSINDVIELRVTAGELNEYEERLDDLETFALVAVAHDTTLSGAGNAVTDLSVVKSPKLETARNITVEGSGGTTLGTITAASFDGTANVTIKFDVSEIDCGTY